MPEEESSATYELATKLVEWLDIRIEAGPCIIDTNGAVLTHLGQVIDAILNDRWPVVEGNNDAH